MILCWLARILIINGPYLLLVSAPPPRTYSYGPYFDSFCPLHHPCHGLLTRPAPPCMLHLAPLSSIYGEAVDVKASGEHRVVVGAGVLGSEVEIGDRARGVVLRKALGVYICPPSLEVDPK
ncbi:hypothetical protein VNO78_25219 [Psophocarpus tetragonolobus]|uniref:Uncharacterized protein n=1 Tax=Psophocarpus tetragonolobus TaxID=3891 RepID=A0AAN9XF73_PSOTE